MKKQNLFSNEKDIENLRAKSNQYCAKDMGAKSLYLTIRRVEESNAYGASKIFVYKYSFKSKIYQISIGGYPEVSLLEAKEQANKYNEL